MDAAPIGDWTGSECLPGFALSRDIAREPGEKVEAEINSFISRRHAQRVKGDGERAVEESWRESERREEARRAEAATRGGRCDSCGRPPHGPGRIVVRDDGSACEGFPDDPAERCNRCGRSKWCVISVVYEDAGEVER